MFRYTILTATITLCSLTFQGCGGGDAPTVSAPPEISEEERIAQDEERFAREGGGSVDYTKQ